MPEFAPVLVRDLLRCHPWTPWQRRSMRCSPTRRLIWPDHLSHARRVGEHDAITPLALGRAIAESVANARLIMIQHLGTVRCGSVLRRSTPRCCASSLIGMTPAPNARWRKSRRPSRMSPDVEDMLLGTARRVLATVSPPASTGLILLAWWLMPRSAMALQATPTAPPASSPCMFLLVRPRRFSHLSLCLPERGRYDARGSRPGDPADPATTAAITAVPRGGWPPVSPPVTCFDFAPCIVMTGWGGMSWCCRRDGKSNHVHSHARRWELRALPGPMVREDSVITAVSWRRCCSSLATIFAPIPTVQQTSPALRPP